MRTDLLEMNITDEDRAQYWLTLFPELHELDELNDITTRVSNRSLSLLLEEAAIGTLNTRCNVLQDRGTFLGKRLSEWKDANPFYLFYHPLLDSKIESFIENMERLHADAVDSVDLLVEEAVRSLLDHLFELSFRVLVLEINVARMEGKLEGGTPAERYHYYCNVMLENESYVNQLYDEYGTLVDLINLTIDRHLDFLLEIVSNTTRERAAIETNLLDGKSIGTICRIEIGMGDRHRGGRTVAILHLSTGIKLVYKPRSVAMENGFQSLLAWMEAQLIPGALPLKQLRTHSAADCGWVEFIEHLPISNVEEAEQFYLRSGQLLCLLYTLNAADFHYENLIAHGAFPMLIDLESLFHAKAAMPMKEAESGLMLAKARIDNSVQSICLLPTTIFQRVGDRDISMDIGGLSASKEQISPFKSLFVEDIGVDTVRVTRKDSIMKPQVNNPMMDNEYLNSEDYLPYIKTGFITFYNWIMDNRDNYLAAVRDIFSEMSSRFLFRPTYQYGQLLRIATHPDFMRETVHRKVLMHRIGIKMESMFDRILKSEYEDLMCCDIPYFEMKLEAADLTDSSGQVHMGMLKQSPLSIVEDRMNGLCLQDLERQCEFIEISYLNKENRTQDVTQLRFAERLHINRLQPERWIRTATDIAEHIVEQSIQGRNDAGEVDRFWVGPSLEGLEENIWNANVLGLDLYNGNAGIALFLAHMGQVLGRSDLRQAAVEAIAPSRSFLEQMDRNHAYSIGAFTGISGQLYTLNRVAHLYQDQTLHSLVSSHVDLLARLVSEDKVLDIVGGTTGSLAVLLSLHTTQTNEAQRSRILDIAIKHYEHLAAGATEEDGMISWPTQFLPAYSGFSHGNAGNAAYLSKLYALTGIPAIKATIDKALAFERSLYSSSHNNWYSTAKKDKISSGWCHGAPGVLLSKLMMKEHGYEDRELDREIAIAIASTCANGIGNNPTYCHGDLGSLAILQYASRITNNRELGNRCIASFQQLYEDVLAGQWNKGSMRCTRSFSLLIGLAGIGYSLMKNYSPDSAPEFLWLE